MQKQTDPLLTWQDPAAADRAAYAARVKELLGQIESAPTPQAAYSREWLQAELARAAEIDEIDRPLEEKRARARVAYETAFAAFRAAIAAVAKATSDDARDVAELARIKATRVVNSAQAELVAAQETRAPLPKPPWANLLAILYQVQDNTEQLAKHAPALATYETGFQNEAITIATNLGRLATLGDMRLVAVAELGYKDRATQQLFAYRWLVACNALGIPCDSSQLDLPTPIVSRPKDTEYARRLRAYVGA